MLTLQLATILAGLGLLALYPPAHGRMILIALSPGAEQSMLARAIARGAAPIGAGPLARSFIVLGDRDRIAPGMFARGVLILAAPPAGCGSFAGAA